MPFTRKRNTPSQHELIKRFDRVAEAFVTRGRIHCQAKRHRQALADYDSKQPAAAQPEAEAQA